MRSLLGSAALILLIVLPSAQTGPVCRTATADEAEPHRSPVDLAVLPDGRRAVTANQTSDTVSLVDLEQGKVLAEVPCGRKPSGVAASPDGKRAAVSNLWSGTVALLEVEPAGLKPVGRVA